jgi:predicted transcriptional regulator
MLTLEGETMSQVSKRLEKAFEAVKTWPADRQEAAAEVLEHMNRLATTPYELSTEELADIEEALAEARRGEFASDAEVAAMFARHGL